jgi:RNA polymerase sigma-70 factor (ECF subfamily)
VCPDGLDKRIDDRESGNEDPRATPPEPPPESELEIEKKWLQWTRVDPERFRLFYDKYHDRIFRFVYFRVDEDYEVAGELTGEVFTLAWEKLGSFRWQGYSFGAWLFHIARQVVGRHWRGSRKTPEERFEAERAEIMAPRQPDAETQDRLDRALLRRAVRELVPDRQEVFILHYWMGFTTREIALITKKGEPLVKAHLQRGRKQMRRWLTEHGMEYGMSKKNLDAVKREEVRESGWDLVVKKNE